MGEYDAGLMAAVATMAALMARLATGEGQHIDISKFETMVTLERVAAGRYANDPDAPPLPGMVAGLLACQDGHVVIAPAQNHQWDALVQLMGSPPWTQEERCQNEVSRALNRDSIQPLLEEWAAQQRKEDLFVRGQALSVPIGPVRNAGEIMEWRQAQPPRLLRRDRSPPGRAPAVSHRRLSAIGDALARPAGRPSPGRAQRGHLLPPPGLLARGPGAPGRRRASSSDGQP